MPTRKDWLPYGVAKRRVALRQIALRIDDFAAPLGLSAAQVDRIKAIAEEYSFAVTIYEHNRVSSKALRTWRDAVISNKRSNKLAEPFPAFDNTPPPAGTRLGLIAEIRRYVRLIKGSSGFTRDIGAGLNIMSPNHVKKPLIELKPMPKVTSLDGYRVKIACEMQGMSALRVEYRRKSEEKWAVVAVLTNLPETIYIEPRVMGVPEGGQIRCLFLQKNKVVGQPSNMPYVNLFAS